MRHHPLLLTATLSAAFLLTNCADSDVFNTSYGLPSGGWEADDSLRFPVTVVQEPSASSRIATARAYDVQLALRHTLDFPDSAVCLQMFVQQLDSAGGIRRTLYRQRIKAPLVAPDGDWLGSTWGSLVQLSYDVKPLQLSFPAAGHYQIVLCPEEDIRPSSGLKTVCLSLRQAP